MGRKQFLAQRLIELARILRQTDVILLVDSLQLGVETTDDHILETVCLNLGPVLDLVRGYILDIARHIVRGKGIGTLRADGRHQLVVLIRDKVLSSHLTDAVDAAIGLTALLRVCQLAILLVTLLDVGQQWSLLCRVSHAELSRSLEHDML